MSLHIDEIHTDVDVSPAPGSAANSAQAAAAAPPPIWQLVEQMRRQLCLMLADDSRTQAIGNDD